MPRIDAGPTQGDVQAAGERGATRSARSSSLVCPHCSQRGISSWAARYSSAGYPAVCSACQRLSHTIASTSSGIPLLTLCIMGGAVVAGLSTESLLVTLLGMVAAVAFNLWAWRRVCMVPTLAGYAASAKRAGWWFGLASVLSIFMG